MGLEVTPVAGRADLRAFIDLPFRLYDTAPLWVPPLRFDIKHRLDRAKMQNHLAMIEGYCMRIRKGLERIPYACVPFVLMRKYPPPPGAEVAFDLRALVNGPFSWLIAVAAFALGFYWEFRRAM